MWKSAASPKMWQQWSVFKMILTSFFNCRGLRYHNFLSNDATSTESTTVTRCTRYSTTLRENKKSCVMLGFCTTTMHDPTLPKSQWHSLKTSLLGCSNIHQAIWDLAAASFGSFSMRKNSGEREERFETRWQPQTMGDSHNSAQN